MRRGWLPLALMTTLIVALGAYSEVQHSTFLGKLNLNSLLLETMPLALVSLGQTSALLVGGFDVSVAALMTMCVVTASFTITPTMSGIALVPGALAIVGVGLATGVFNAFLIRVLRLPSIVATLGTLSVLEGASLLLRSFPEGPINTDVTSALTAGVGFVPFAFVGVVLLALLADFWLYRTRAGLALRAVGLDATSSRRLGMPTGRTILVAFVLCSVMASVAGFYLAAEVQIGSPIIGSQALESIAAAVLGGAALSGGKGSFVGSMLAALFLTEIDNVLPLFQQPAEYADMTIGVLILLALVLYQAPELVARFRAGRQTLPVAASEAQVERIGCAGRPRGRRRPRPRAPARRRSSTGGAATTSRRRSRCRRPGGTRRTRRARRACRS
jgi:ribose transport system ATP-binding protein